MSRVKILLNHPVLLAALVEASLAAIILHLISEVPVLNRLGDSPFLALWDGRLILPLLILMIAGWRISSQKHTPSEWARAFAIAIPLGGALLLTAALIAFVGVIVVLLVSCKVTECSFGL